MATSLLLLLDDIASVLDDVGAMTKAATAKTAGVIGDDLALNAHQVSGVDPARELAVVWRVALGSLRNKAILVPAALVLSWLAPWAVGPLLMLGGAYLCYEGFEKVFHSLVPGVKHAHGGGASDPDPHADPDSPPSARGDRAAAEREKIAGAVRTDFILSAEIIVITLGVVAGQPAGIQVAVLTVVALAMTVGVYGLVAGIVRLDDLGLGLALRGSIALRAVGRGILAAAPWLLRGLSIAGTAAMFLVGGGIITHGIPSIHAVTSGGGHGAATGSSAHPDWWRMISSGGAEAAVGIAVGAIAVIVVTGLKWLARGRESPRRPA